MAWLEKFKGPKYPSTTAPQDATRTNYTPTFQNPTYANTRKINFANSPEQYEINSNTGQTTGRGGLEDATLDAIDAIGALNIPLTLGKAAARGIVKKLPNLKNAVLGTNDVLEEILGKAFFDKKNKKAIKEGNEWLQNWINHPATQAKIDKDIQKASDLYINGLQDLDISPAEKILKTFNYDKKLNLAKKQAKNYIPDVKEYPLSKQINQNLQQYLNKDAELPIHIDNYGVDYTHAYSPIERQMRLELNELPDRYGSWVSRKFAGQENRTATTIHEGTHGWVPNETLVRSGKRNLILKDLNPTIKKNLMDWEYVRSIGGNPFSVLPKEEAFQGYIADPTEMHARTMELRHHFGLTPDKVVTEKDAKHIINTLKSSKQSPITGLNAYLNVVNHSPKKLSELFNNFWSVAPAAIPVGAIGAGAMQQKAEGGVVSNLRSQLNLKPKEKATSNHVMQLYENLNLGNFNKEVSDYLTSIKDEEELLTHLNKFDEGGIQGRPLISQRPPQFMANQVPLYSTDNNTEVAPEMAPSRLPDPTVEMVEPTIAAPIPTVPSAKPVKQPLLNTTSGTHIATPSAVDKRTLPKTVKPIVNSAHKVETKIESTPVKPLQKSTVTNITKSTSKLPSDALQVLEEKSKNPAWASFKGKYSIYSKENSTLYLFDNNHKLVDQIVAGRGMTKGDFPNTADAHKSAKSNKLKATTPAGSYAIWEERKNSPKSGYGNKTYIYGQPNEAGTATALHDAWGKGNDDEEYERRMAILNDPKIKQKLFSYGCINIPTGWLDKNDANINVGDSVFITPEPMQINLLGKR